MMGRNTWIMLAFAGTFSSAVAGPAPGGTLDLDFSSAAFGDPTNVDNDFWPLSVMAGPAWYKSESDEGCEVNRIMVSGATRSGFGPPYDDITAIVVDEEAWVDEECAGSYVLIERTQDWHAQDDDDNVWYLGEATTAWDDENGCLTSAGAWEAGRDGAEAGVVVLGRPVVGVSYQQEYYEGEAEDRGKILRLDAPVSIELGNYVGCMKTKDYTPLSPGEVEHKFYCRMSQGGPGLALVNELKGRTRRVEYVGTEAPDGEFATDFPTDEICGE